MWGEKQLNVRGELIVGEITLKEMHFVPTFQVISFIAAVLGKTGTKADIFCKFMNTKTKVKQVSKRRLSVSISTSKTSQRTQQCWDLFVEWISFSVHQVIFRELWQSSHFRDEALMY